MSQDSGRGGWWAPFIGMRGAAGETTTRESSTVSFQTKAGIQVAGWLVIVLLGFPGTVLGSWLTILGVNRMLNLNLTGHDIATALVALAIVVSVGRFLFYNIGASHSKVVKNLMGVFGAIVAFLLVFALYSADKLTMTAGVWLCILFGPGLMYASPLLVYNMTMHLRDPFGFESPFEREFLDLYRQERGLNGEAIEKQEPEKSILEVHVTENGSPGTTTRILDTNMLGITEEALVRFAAGVLNGRPISESEWIRDWAFPQGINQFRRARSILANAGLIERINPENVNSSYQMTPSGRAVFKRLTE